MTKRAVRQIQYRVIAGKLKGRRISVPDLGVTRPPLERLRRSLFDFLMPRLDGAEYLDLFSGTGSYLFEAVSRGVESALGIELGSQLAEAINSQASKYEVSDQLTCRCGNVLDAIPAFAKASHLFDLVILAPPQYKGMVDQTLALMVEHSIVAEDGLVICQYATSESIEIDFEFFSLIENRKYGNTTFTILTPKKKGDPEAASSESE